jgi:hypothetical protein
MVIWLDDPEADHEFKEILKKIMQFRSGEVANLMEQHGMKYRQNWGVSVVDLKKIAGESVPSHVLALKLWNKQWRETMILASLLDEPDQVSEEQMDFWTKSLDNSEIAEQLSFNLWWKTPWAYVKAMEWCRGKKHWMRYTAVHLAGRLALVDKKSPDEMFDPFFEEFLPLAKDNMLSVILYRTMILFVERSPELKNEVLAFVEEIRNSGSEVAISLAVEIFTGIQGSRTFRSPTTSS